MSARASVKLYKQIYNTITCVRVCMLKLNYFNQNICERKNL